MKQLWADLGLSSLTSAVEGYPSYLVWGQARVTTVWRMPRRWWKV